jgi:hypothetical protein
MKRRPRGRTSTHNLHEKDHPKVPLDGTLRGCIMITPRRWVRRDRGFRDLGRDRRRGPVREQKTAARVGISFERDLLELEPDPFRADARTGPRPTSASVPSLGAYVRA